MSKYIDAEKLYKEIDGRMAKFAELETEAETDDMSLSLPTYYQGKRKMCSEILTLIDSLQHEHLAEWSKEDEGALGDAICAADILGNDESFKKDNPRLAKAFIAAKDWLKFLPERFNLQTKQEWSENDKLHLNNAILAAEKEWGTGSCTVKFLKSFRPSWKPNKKQPEVDLEKEMRKYFEGWRINYYSETEELLKNNGCTVDIDDVKEVASHFYELGLNARKEDK